MGSTEPRTAFSAAADEITAGVDSDPEGESISQGQVHMKMQHQLV